jgi:hypothetical protein
MPYTIAILSFLRWRTLLVYAVALRYASLMEMVLSDEDMPMSSFFRLHAHWLPSGVACR